uniref:Uncharacterized protein n=1 Tax=Peronospora matthiolae TaxID=2874970 RepID=A0AAV1UIQ4_9STRA
MGVFRFYSETVESAQVGDGTYSQPLGERCTSRNSFSVSKAATTTTEYEDFVFDPSRFPPSGVAHLKQLCADRSSADRKLLLRKGTDDERKIIVGIAKGYMACRSMPDFLRAVQDSKERLRLYSTVQAQVKGHLVLNLGHTPKFR